MGVAWNERETGEEAGAGIPPPSATLTCRCCRRLTGLWWHLHLHSKEQTDASACRTVARQQLGAAAARSSLDAWHCATAAPFASHAVPPQREGVELSSSYIPRQISSSGAHLIGTCAWITKLASCIGRTWSSSSSHHALMCWIHFFSMGPRAWDGVCSPA